MSLETRTRCRCDENITDQVWPSAWPVTRGGRGNQLCMKCNYLDSVLTNRYNYIVKLICHPQPTIPAYIIQNTFSTLYIYSLPQINWPVGFWLLEALKFDLLINVGEFLKNQEILYLIGSEIFQFGPRRAEQFTFKDFNLNFKIWPKCRFYQNVPHKNKLSFGGT